MYAPFRIEKPSKDPLSGMTFVPYVEALHDRTSRSMYRTLKGIEVRQVRIVALEAKPGMPLALLTLDRTPIRSMADYLFVMLHGTRGTRWIGRMCGLNPNKRLILVEPRQDATNQGHARAAFRRGDLIHKIALGTLSPREITVYSAQPDGSWNRTSDEATPTATQAV